jgi:hypothetical protein
MEITREAIARGIQIKEPLFADELSVAYKQSFNFVLKLTHVKFTNWTSVLQNMFTKTISYFAAISELNKWFEITETINK